MFKLGTLPLGAIVTRFLSSVLFSLCLTLLGITLAAAQINTLPRISITPLNPSVSSGGKLQFTALVVNTSETGVRWWASAGTISRDGLFLAPEVTSQQFVRVTAASVVGLAVRASVEVAVIPAQPLRITTSRLAAANIDSSYDAQLSARGGTSPYHWTLSSGALPPGVRLKRSTGVISGVPSKTGTFEFAVTLKDARAEETTRPLALTVSPVFSGTFDGPAELPRVYLQTARSDTPAPGKIIPVRAGGDFQAALNRANCGDTITLQAGATFAGDFSFPQKSCDAARWITVRTSAPDSELPPEGSRLTPCYAGVSSLPGRPDFHCSCTKNVLAKLLFAGASGNGPVTFAAGANHYRLEGLEITRVVSENRITALVAPEVRSPADHIILDRVWVHGTPHDETTRGVFLNNTSYVAIVDSFFTDFHCVAITGACTDAQAIGGGGGDLPSGPYKIVNNFLEASGENILFGGGPATTTPADIEVRHNHLFKPLIWMSGQPGYVGGTDGHPFIVKNLFELKNAQRVLFEGNVAEYTWGGFTQAGYALMLTPKNQAGADGSNLCPACVVTDVTVRYSTISHAGAGINIANSVSSNGGIASAGRRYSIHDITIDDINGDVYLGGGPLILVLNGWRNHVLSDITINHITGFGNSSLSTLAVGNDLSHPKMSHFVYTNNLVLAGQYPVWSAGGKTDCAHSTVPIRVIDTCFEPYAFANNAIIGSPANYPPAKWPPRNYFPPDAAAVHFTHYNKAKGGDYRLLPSSPFKHAGTDGKDLGADIDAIEAATQGAD
jgi:Putative Ig domain